MGQRERSQQSGFSEKIQYFPLIFPKLILFGTSSVGREGSGCPDNEILYLVRTSPMKQLKVSSAHGGVVALRGVVGAPRHRSVSPGNVRPGAEVSLTLPRGPPVGTADREVDSGGLPVSTADREVDLGGLPVGTADREVGSVRPPVGTADREGGSGGPPVGTADRKVGSVPAGSGFQASHRSTRLTGRGFRGPPADTVLGAGSEKLLPRDAHPRPLPCKA